MKLFINFLKILLLLGFAATELTAADAVTKKTSYRLAANDTASHKRIGSIFFDVFNDQNRACITQLYVNPENRSQRVGGYLFSEAVRRIAQMNIQIIDFKSKVLDFSIESNLTQDALDEFYERLGSTKAPAANQCPLLSGTKFYFDHQDPASLARLVTQKPTEYYVVLSVEVDDDEEARE